MMIIKKRPTFTELWCKPQEISFFPTSKTLKNKSMCARLQKRHIILTCVRKFLVQSRVKKTQEAGELKMNFAHFHWCISLLFFPQRWSCVTFWFKFSLKVRENTQSDAFLFEGSSRNQRAERRRGQLGAVATNGQKRATWCQLLLASGRLAG